MQRVENSINVVFSAISQLKFEINDINARIIEAEALPELEVEEFEVIPRGKATTMIKEYVSNNPGCRTSEIISDLHLDLNLALDILRKLKKDGKLRSEEVV